MQLETDVGNELPLALLSVTHPCLAVVEVNIKKNYNNQLHTPVSERLSEKEKE